MATANLSSDANIDTAPGVVGAYHGDNEVLKILVVVFAGMTFYNAIELVALIFTTFKTHKSLYFWSLLIATLGLIPYAFGFTVKLLGIWEGRGRWIGVVLITIGWYTMVTGQSVVLWSRLHLIVTGERGRKILKFTKWMIITNVLILHIPTSVVTFGSNGYLSTARFIKAYNVIEKYQMTGFCLQEFVLSLIYIVETLGVLRTSLREDTRSIMRQLVVINIAIILMDVALLGIEYASLFLLETILKGFLYSLKLKIEFAILGRLVQFVGGDDRSRGDSIGFVPSATLASLDTKSAIAGSQLENTSMRNFPQVPRQGAGHLQEIMPVSPKGKSRSREVEKPEIWEIEEL